MKAMASFSVSFFSFAAHADEKKRKKPRDRKNRTHAEKNRILFEKREDFFTIFLVLPQRHLENKDFTLSEFLEDSLNTDYIGSHLGHLTGKPKIGPVRS